MTAYTVAPNETDLHKIVTAVTQLGQGRSNANGTVTLTTGAASTTVTAVNCGSGAGVWLFPATANAATELGNGTIYVGTVSNGSFVITHANSATTLRTFYWIALG